MTKTIFLENIDPGITPPTTKRRPIRNFKFCQQVNHFHPLTGDIKASVSGYPFVDNKNISEEDRHRFQPHGTFWNGFPRSSCHVSCARLRHIRPRPYRRNICVINGLRVPFSLNFAIGARFGIEPKTQECHAVNKPGRAVRSNANITLLDCLPVGMYKRIPALILR